MTIQRDDLVAAAGLGLLQYRQIDPLLVYLLQRDVLAQRRALQAQAQERPRGWHALLFYLAIYSAIAGGGVFAATTATQAMAAGGIGAVFFFTALYGLAAYILFAWILRRGYAARIHMLPTFMMATVPLAVFALQQMST
jgi:hypothetical protein